MNAVYLEGGWRKAAAVTGLRSLLWHVRQHAQSTSPFHRNKLFSSPSLRTLGSTISCRGAGEGVTRRVQQSGTKERGDAAPLAVLC